MPRFLTHLAFPTMLLGLIGLLPASAQPVQEARPIRVGRAVQPTPVTNSNTVSDAEALGQAGLSPTDGAKLVGYLKQRTVSDTDQGKLQELIKKFGADRFDDRLAAAAEVETFGPAAIGPLKAIVRDEKGDPEISYRASLVLKKLENIPHGAVAAAAVRAVVKLKPPGAAEALLGFLPLADSETLAEEIRGALVALAVRDGKAEPVLVTALEDPSPLRRSAAYVALIEGGPAKERIHIPEVYPQVKEAVRSDSDVEARFTGLWSLVRTTREKEFIPDLIAMIPQLPRGRVWQLEELLLQIAGKHPEGGRFGKSEEALLKARDVWTAWWKANRDSLDLASKAFKLRTEGFTDLVEYDPRGYVLARIVTLGPDLKEKFSFTGTRSPIDARMQPNGLFLVIDSGRVNERQADGDMTILKALNQPMYAEKTAEGSLFVVCRAMIVEYDKSGNQLWIHARPNNDILTGRRLPGGDVIFVTSNPQGPNCFRLDRKLNPVGKPMTLGRMLNQQWNGMDVVGEDRILLCEQNRVVEYDLKTAKAGWNYTMNMATSVQRLPNGNTLIASVNQNKAVEVTPDGEVVWEYQAKDGLSVARAYRR